LNSLNNHCECPDCRKLSPSDWYAKLVNSISDRLTDNKVNTRLVFLCYANTLWAPNREKIESEHGSVVFMFAPITRCYLHPLTETRCSGLESLKPPPRNGMAPPRTNYEFIQFLRWWQRAVQSDSFLFDYHFWDIFGLDFLGGDIGEILWNDVRDLKGLGLNGVLSCQTLRAFYPTGVSMAILAEMLWDRGVSLEDIRGHYLRAAFGNDSSYVSDYLRKIYSFGNPKMDYEHDGAIITPQREKVEELLEFVKASRHRIEEIACARRGKGPSGSAYILLHHNAYVTLILEAIVHYLQGERQEALKSINEAMNHFLSTEEETLKVADVYLISNALDRISAKIQSGNLRVR